MFKTALRGSFLRAQTVAERLVEGEEILDNKSSLVVGSNSSDGKMRIERIVLGVIGEENLAGEFHLTLFSECDGGETVAAIVVLAIFNLGEIEILVLARD